MKKFVLLALSDKFTKSELEELRVASHKAVEAIVGVRQNKTVTCKIHNLLHYHKLILYFGPLSHYTTLHYEHHHQISKKISRSTMNFKNIVMTISNRHQLRLAIIEEKNNFIHKNFFKFHQNSFRINPQNSLPLKSQILTSKLRPFKLKHNILRKVKRNEWFHIDQFWQDSTSEIWCEGSFFFIKQEKQEKIVSTLTHGSFYVLNKRNDRVYIKLLELNSFTHHNDYIFKHNNINYLIIMRNV